MWKRTSREPWWPWRPREAATCARPSPCAPGPGVTMAWDGQGLGCPYEGAVPASRVAWVARRLLEARACDFKPIGTWIAVREAAAR